MTELIVTDILRDEGTIVVMVGMTTDGTDRSVIFGCDHRPAQDIIVGLAYGDDCYVEIEDYQIIGAAA